MIAITDCTRSVSRILISSLLKDEQSLKVLVEEKNRFLLPSELAQNNKIEFVIGNLLDIQSLDSLMKDVDIVYHFAEIVTFKKKTKKKMYQVNIEGTTNVVNVALYSKVRKIVFCSSYLSLGNKPEGLEFDELTKWNDYNAAHGYGWSKHLAEREIWRGINENLEAIIINSGHIMGDELLNSEYLTTYQWLIKNKVFPEGKLPIIDEYDLVSIILKLVEKGFVNEKFLVFNEMISYKNLLTLINDVNQINDEFSPISYSKLTEKLSFRWIYSLIKRDNLAPSNGLSLVISNDRKYSNKKLVSALECTFKDLKATIEKVAQLIKVA